MNRRFAVAYLGEDPTVRDRTARAAEALRGGSGPPEFVAFRPAELTDSAGETELLADACAVVTTPTALGDERVSNRIDEMSDRALTVAVADSADLETVHRLLDADIDGVVTTESARAGETDPDADPLVDTLAEAVWRRSLRLSHPDLNRLGDVLLDAGTTLMSAHADEVATKTDWTMANVGETAGLDRICCYVRQSESDRLEPAYGWGRRNANASTHVIDDFPDADRLETFENVATSFVPAEHQPETDDGYRPRSHSRSAPPATVHVPLVADWELLGVVAFETDDPRLWTDEEVDLFRTFGDLIAYTIARNERRLELRQQTERLEQFSAVVSHDLRNPINVLAGYLDMIEGDVPQSRYDAMDRAITRMETLIDDLLVLARRGDTIGDTESVSVTTLAEKAWSSVRAPDATLTVTEEIDGVIADPNRLRQAFENLFRNAVDHGGPDISIEIGPRSGQSGGRGIYVADDGPGIPADAKDSLFESGFSTADSSGIGLAIVRRIVDAHGWEIDVRNDSGAVFELCFESEANADAELETTPA